MRPRRARERSQRATHRLPSRVPWQRPMSISSRLTVVSRRVQKSWPSLHRRRRRRTRMQANLPRQPRLLRRHAMPRMRHRRLVIRQPSRRDRRPVSSQLLFVSFSGRQLFGTSAFRDVLGARPNCRRLTLLFEFAHERFACRAILELPEMIFDAFEDQRIHGELHTFAHAQGRR
jgi:hypothetical protein